MKPPRAPQKEDSRIDQQFHDGGSGDTANHWRSDALLHVRAGTVASHDWQKTRNDHRGGHGFGPNALHSPVVDGVAADR